MWLLLIIALWCDCRSGNIETIIGTDIIGKDGNKVTLSAKYVGKFNQT